MNIRTYASDSAAIALVAVILSACGGGSPAPAPAPTPSTFTIGGTISGLNGTLVLQNSGGNNLSVSTSGAFTFSTAIASGATYAVTVLTQPTGQTCAIASGSGSVASANITNVAVTCINNTYTIGGTMSGLGVGKNIVLQNNGGNPVNVTANSAFAFSTPLISGASYAVTVLTQPAGQSCTIANGNGVVATANVTSVAVTCTTISAGGFTIGGALSGLSLGKSVLLRGESDGVTGTLALSANGAFTMPSTFPDHAEYFLNVQTQPLDQLCTVTNGTGDIAGANVTTILVNCVAKAAGAKNWDVAATLSKDIDREFTPSVAVDASGNAMAVWELERYFGGPGEIWYSRYTAGSGWSTPAEIPPQFPYNSQNPFAQSMRSPQVAIDPTNGNPVAVWRQRWVFEETLYSSRYSGGAWSTPTVIGPTNFGVTQNIINITEFKFAFDANGNALVVWRDDGQHNDDGSGSSARNIGYTRYVVGSGWLASVNPAGNWVSALAAIRVYKPDLAVNASGDAIAVWEQRVDFGTPSRHDIFSSRFNVATLSWSTPQLVEQEDADFARDVSVVLDSNGNATAAWTYFDGARQYVRSSRNVGGTWSSVISLETDNTRAYDGAYDPRLAIDGTGHVLAMWRQYIAGTGYYMASRYTPGSGWSTPQSIGNYVGPTDHFPDTEYDIVANAAGNAVAVWTLSAGEITENVPYGAQLWSNQYVAGSGWSFQEVIDANPSQEPSHSAALPSVAIDPSGNAIAVWEGPDSDTQANDILFNRMH